MIKQKLIVIRWHMFIIKNLFNSMEVIFSVEYIIPLLIIDRLFNWVFPVI